MRLAESPFDSHHYGLRIGRWDPDPGDGDAELQAVRRADFDVVFVRVDEQDPLNALLGTPVDTLVTSKLGHGRLATRPLPGVSIEHHDRLAGRDVDVVAAVTAETIQTSHLHADPRLPIARTRELYAAWARNDVTGRGQHVIVARIGGELAGYISILVRDETAIIDLVAVATSRQGAGFGSAMLASFTSWVDERKLAATVGTQSHNPALQLYIRHGFVPAEKHFTYHLWLR